MFSELKKKGWKILKANDLSSLSHLRTEMEKESQVFLADSSGRALTELLPGQDPVKLNDLYQKLNFKLMQFSDSILRAFSEELKQICGSSVYYQKRPYLRANLPNDTLSATDAHSDVFYGHSPYTYTLWFPLYDVSDGSGIYIYDRAVSNEITKNYDFNDSANQVEKLGGKKPEGIKVKFGEGILFECHLIHGAHVNPGPNARISLDTRIQSTKYPLFEKGAELYQVETL